MEYIAYRSVRYMDFARATITRDIFITGLTQCGLSRSLKGNCIEFKYYADGIHSGLTSPGNNS